MAAKPGIVGIRIVRGPTVFNVHGEKAGQEGIWLAADQVQGIYDTPIKSTWKTGAFQKGAHHKATKYLYRDMILGFHVIETITNTYEFNESLFRQIFAYGEDEWSENPVPTTIEVETELSGVRKLDVLMYEEPQFQPSTDPIRQQYGNLILKLRAGQPFWYFDDETDEFTSTASQAAGTLLVSNPTDLVCYHKWVATPAATSGSAIWTVPDFSWVGEPGAREPGGEYGERLVNDITVTAANGGMTMDTDRENLMFRDANNTNAQGQLGGSKILYHGIPPYTPPQALPVSYKGATGGATIQVRMPRKWSRPWGMEGVTIIEPLAPQDVTVRFAGVGSYEFQVPPWCERLDIVISSAGGGGEGGGLLTLGSGGEAGEWAYGTYIRGVDIPWDSHSIKGVIGEGGSGGVGMDWDWEPGGVEGQPGGNTTATAAGMVTLEAVGGAGGASAETWYGEGLDDLLFNGITYHGCGPEHVAGRPGNKPGGGGAGGWPLIGRGGEGGNGRVWIRAYGWAGS